MGIRLNSQDQKEVLPVSYGSAKRTPPRFRWSMVVLLVSIPFMVLLYQLMKEYVLIRFSGLVVFDTMIIRSPADGFIQDLYINVGKKIQKEEPLLRLVSPEVSAKLNALQDEKARILRLMDVISKQNTNELSTLLTVLKGDIDFSAGVYQRFQNYVQKGNMAELQLEEARQNYVGAQKNYAELEQQIKEVDLKNLTLLEVSYRRRIFEIESDIAQIQAKMTSFNMKSPVPGTVMNVMTYQGEFVALGQNLVNIVTDKNVKVMVFIDGKYVKEVYPGKRVTVRFPDRQTVPGHIINTPGYAEKVPLSLSNPLATRENKLIAMVKLDSNFPDKYEIYGIPVTVKLEGVGL